MSVGSSGRGDDPVNRILVVDDDEDVREALSLSLELEGYATGVAKNGNEALAWLRAHPRPCLVLLDLMMPELDGWGTIDALESDPRLAGIPVVIVTAFGGELGGAAARKVLRKPIELPELLAVAARNCGARG